MASSHVMTSVAYAIAGVRRAGRQWVGLVRGHTRPRVARCPFQATRFRAGGEPPDGYTPPRVARPPDVAEELFAFTCRTQTATILSSVQTSPATARRGRGRRAWSRQEQADRRGLEECSGRSGCGLRVRAGDEPAFLSRPRPDPCARALLARGGADPGGGARAAAWRSAARLVVSVRSGPSRCRCRRLAVHHDRRLPMV